MAKPIISLSKIAAIFLIFSLGLLVFGNWRLMKARKKVAVKLENAQESLNNTSLEKEALQGKILQSQTYEYLERVGREELDFKKPGEQVVAFPEQNSDRQNDTSEKIEELWRKFSEMRQKEKEEKSRE